MKVKTRFAPSPTGFLHIGSARTALFNWLFARHHGGEFHLRIEDTDRERSTQPAVEAIIDGMQWLGLQWDGDIIYQFTRAARHAEVARQLVEQGKAYRCYCTQEELQKMREEAQAAGKPFQYDRRWRDRTDTPPGVYAIRLKAPLEGEIAVRDHVQGEVKVAASQLDDMVLLRSDGTPTYLLAVVVDDHDMDITHVIRGDDHLTNTFRQRLIYDALGWAAPEFAHIPLIHGADGAKLSKRHGALGVDAYRDMGYLPEALRNYLLRLGWAHGNDEIISTEQAIGWFTLEGVGKSPSRFDFVKLENLNGHYIREADDARLVELVLPLLSPSPSPLVGKGGVGGNSPQPSMLKQPPHPNPPPQGGREYERLIRGMAGLKQRAKNLNELADNARFYVLPRPLAMDEKAALIIEKSAAEVIVPLLPQFEALTHWTQSALEAIARAHSDSSGKKLGDIAQPLRAALTGRTISPSVFEVMEVLGKEETLGRLRDVC